MPRTLILARHTRFPAKSVRHFVYIKVEASIFEVVLIYKSQNITKKKKIFVNDKMKILKFTPITSE